MKINNFEYKSDIRPGNKVWFWGYDGRGRVKIQFATVSEVVIQDEFHYDFKLKGQGDRVYSQNELYLSFVEIVSAINKVRI
jgi:hypothetical protein